MIAALLFASMAGALHVSSCTIGATKVPASCGTLTVYEDRTKAAGRTIDLYFIVLKARVPTHRAIVFNPGGPGGSSTADAPLLAGGKFLTEFASLRDRYDVLFVDNRGTGQSAPQNCDIAPYADPQAYFLQWWPDAIIRQCRATLAAHANLSLYATPYAVADLDDVRKALGYDKLVLDGGSYGTQFYLAYARTYPNHVESMVLRSVAPPHFFRIPLPDAGGFQTALDNLAKECVADASCRKQFPNFREHFIAVANRFDRGPVAVPLWSDRANRIASVRLSREIFFERMRKALYDPDTAKYIPVIIEHAYRGDYAPLALFVQEMSQSVAADQANGLNLSVSCAEDVPFITEAQIKSSSAGSLEGDLRVRAQQHACSIWNVRPVGAAFDEPVRTSVPTLMIGFSDDPATPPAYAREELKYLRHGRLMIVQGGSHVSDAPCIDRIADQFVRTHSVAATAMRKCSGSYRRPPFATSLAYYQMGSNGNPALTARLRAFLEKWQRGTLDRSQLTESLSRQYSQQVAAQVSQDLAEIGAFDSFRFLARRPSPKGTLYSYAVRGRTAYFLGTFTLDRNSRIADMDLSP